MTEPLRLIFQVSCPADHAFRTWTARTSAWWPLDHTVSGADGVRIVIEPRAGGRILERTPDGREIPWGEVRAWDPPRSLSYLWHLGADRESATDVTISFVEVGPGETRVEIEHSGWERLGDGAATRRERNRSGWEGVLTAYVAACATVEEVSR